MLARMSSERDFLGMCNGHSHPQLPLQFYPMWVFLASQPLTVQMASTRKYFDIFLCKGHIKGRLCDIKEK